MYEALTALIPVLKTDNFGEWIVDRAGMCVSLYCATFPDMERQKTILM